MAPKKQFLGEIAHNLHQNHATAWPGDDGNPKADKTKGVKEESIERNSKHGDKKARCKND